MTTGREVLDRYWDATAEAGRRVRAAIVPGLRRVEAYRGLFMLNGELTGPGRRALMHMMKAARLDESPERSARTSTGAVDPYLAGVLEGRRQMVLEITEALFVDPLTFHQLQAEANKDE